jgi:peptidoglycan-N-acetylglucosamine deacetylase
VSVEGRIGIGLLAVTIAAAGAWASPPAGGQAPPQMPPPERLVRTVTPTLLRREADPQFTVELVPGRSVELRGAVSHRLVSSRFVPSGPPVPDRVVALTFDDGPSKYTARFVAELKRLGVPATFFVIGTQVAERPELVRLEADSGMAVGDHTWSHPWRTPFARLPASKIRSEIGGGLAALRRIGVPTRLFRPPGGNYSPFVLREARRRGLRVVLWSVDARDWVAGSTAAEIERRVLSAVRPGSIVVMHDGGGNREATLAALPRIVARIRARGLAFVALAPVG